MSHTQAAPQTQESKLQALTCLTKYSSSLGSWVMIWAIRDWSGTGRLPRLLLRGLARGRLPLPPSKLTRLLRLGPALPALHDLQASGFRVGFGFVSFLMLPCLFCSFPPFSFFFYLFCPTLCLGPALPGLHGFQALDLRLGT